jgi:hypothetical protein
MFELKQPTTVLLTADRLREVLHYDPLTGFFTWRVTLSRRNQAGNRTGKTRRADRRVYIGVDNGLYLAHRLAWLYVHGRWPEPLIDHIDGDASNNAISNLREATQAENTQNLHRAHRDNRSGFLGVQCARNGKFAARLKSGPILVFGKKRDSPQQAHQDYLEIKRALHPFATI